MGVVGTYIPRLTAHKGPYGGHVDDKRHTAAGHWPALNDI